MSLFVVDCETDGNIIGDHSMICFAAVKVNREMDTTFYGKTKPISKQYIEKTLAVSGFSRHEHENFDDPRAVMADFFNWISMTTNGKPVLISDNNGYDASWINYYFLKFYGENPFGWSSRRIGDLFCGAENNLFYQWKKHRTTKHDHNPLNDCFGNVEALLYFFDKFKIKIPK